MVVSRLTAAGPRKIEAKREAWQGRWEQALEGVEREDLRAAHARARSARRVFEEAPGEAA